MLVAIRLVITKSEFAFQFDVLAASQGAAFGANQNVFVVEFAVVFDSHVQAG